MNKTKKALIATSLAGVMAAGAGFGTFSWFTESQETGSSEVQAGTLSLTDITEERVFSTEGQLLQPVTVGTAENNPGEYMAEGNAITFENDGNLALDPRLMLDVETNGIDGADGNDYKIRMNLERTGSVDWSGQSEWKNANEIDAPINEWFRSEENGFQEDMQPGDAVTVSFDVYLDQEAGNAYQDSSVTGTLRVDGKQTVENAEYPEDE
ncbi:hypothetical protein [Salibacterium halotolerans]|uniref:Alternate signal-mediated exported protein, RER_14450 family n=1 Tax=Salibacterium halotolerans TaxID=1884432 RepID=A0A1I5V5Z4_9BACI|nr:hypothetical protein [Salibacterium halotolerans]SFQ02861.1 alternate signal-mediated exported protein, RER_14450 family [Salibacterium halotolerans]